MCYFQYKMINNILLLNILLHIFGVSETPLCSFCPAKEEQNFIFLLCPVKHNIFGRSSENTSMMTIFCLFHHHRLLFFGFLNISENEDFFLFNHILLVFKLHFYKTGEEKFLNLKMLLMIGMDGYRYKKKWIGIKKRDTKPTKNVHFIV